MSVKYTHYTWCPEWTNRVKIVCARDIEWIYDNHILDGTARPHNFTSYHEGYVLKAQHGSVVNVRPVAATRIKTPAFGE